MDAKADTPAIAVATGDKFVFGDISADGWDTITAAKLLKTLADATDDAAGVRTALTVPSGTGTVSGTNTGDQDLSGYATTVAVAAAYQPLDSDLTAIAAVTTTSYGRAFLALADAAAARTALALGSLATVTPTGTPDGSKFLRDDNSYQAIPGGGDALTASPLSQFAATTSLQLKGVISDETGSGALVFATSPTLVTPALGVATATSVNGVTLTNGGSGALTVTGTTSVSGANTGDQDLSSYATTAAVAAGYQPLDSDLTAIAALSTTSYGRALLALADAAAGRTAFGLGTLATQSGTFSGTSSGTNTGDQAYTAPKDVSVSFTADGDAYFITPEAMTLAASPTEGGTGTLAYAKAVAADTTSFSGTTLPVTLAVGDVLRVTVSALTTYKGVTLRRSA